MRKKKKLFVWGFQRACIFFTGVLISLNVCAQNAYRVSGTVKDAAGEPAIGATVAVKGAATGTVTDIEGHFQLQVTDNAVLVVSYIGYATQEIPVAGKSVIDVVMKEDNQLLDELVVIGYGTMKKGDLTGSITAIGEKDFQKGLITNSSSLITGKVAGVQITSNSGRAGDGNRIRIRGGASLNASNDPLIVVDGVPLDNAGISGQTNPLASINPNDIESMNILKDASATAIYGSRASNGVIIITTKKGAAGQALQVNLSSQHSIATIAKRVDVLSADEFREVVQNNPYTSPKYIGYLGNANTDWQDEIFRNAFTTDNNLSVSGSVNDFLPYRVSVGFISQDGILDTDNMKRTTANISFNPSLFDKHLNINVNLKGTYTHSRFGNGDAISAAIRMDPTQPVYGEGAAYEKFNGYWNWLSSDGTFNSMATKNPMVLLYSKDDQAHVYRSIGNVQLDYQLHFLPDMRANVNMGYDVSQGKGEVYYQKWSLERLGTGSFSQYDQKKQNVLFESYLNYSKQLNPANRLEVMGGYTYQDFKITDKTFPLMDLDKQNELSPAGIPSAPRNTLISFYGRLNYNLSEKYLLTTTVRRDGSSRFSTENRWGTFPSVALAWRVSEEDFLKNIEALSNLKLRLGWGITGQQEGIGDFEHIARYALSEETAQVQWGDQFYSAWRPAGYDPARKWEQTTTSNIGLDWGFYNNRLYGSIDLFKKDTKDLLAEIDIPMGSNFINRIIKNIGTMNAQGVEFSMNAIPVDTKDLRWELGINATTTQTEITNLALPGGNPTTLVGDISGGTGAKIQAHTVGYAPSSFFVYEQVYDAAGKPIEGLFVDRNQDGQLDAKDKYHYKTPDPLVFIGFNTSLNYRQWTLATALRSNIGHYVYNNAYSDNGNYALVLNTNNYLQNSVRDIQNTGFFTQQLMSDYYVQNASFLKMDYMQLMYDFGKIAKQLELRVNATVQNVFTLTKYQGIDPEIAGGIDRNFYPNPRTFSVGFNLNF
ncbi:MAG: TonB-dependent receptor [Dysgonamonadaceae bacterium]|jgi:iron complex outermembrane receptor protein|nr:TonB-dependent receptor [Dysgonamonadaceae bacterium]